MTVRRVDWPYRSTFRISYKTRTHAETVMVELADGPHVGRSEATGVSYHGETADLLAAQVEAVRDRVEEGLARDELQGLLGPGGARNALDCALWDLECKQQGRRAWEIAGTVEPLPLRTAFTLSLDAPGAMAAAAAAASPYPLLKLKLGAGDDDVERVKAVRRARPEARLIVDANQAWTIEQLASYASALMRLDVLLIEQPLPADRDEALRDFDSPIALCADESCQTAASLPALSGKYEYVNIKLDKAGGLTEALRLRETARSAGFRIMVGCMGGSSLGVAPAFLVGQGADVVDLDAPLLTASDCSFAVRYNNGVMHVPAKELWG